MAAGELNRNVTPAKEYVSLVARTGLIVFCLAAGFSYRVIVGLFPPGMLQFGILLGLALLFLLMMFLVRREPNLNKYWEIPFAFFVFTVAGILGDQGGYIQQMFVRNVLHETPSVNNPLGSTLIGMVAAQLVSTACLILPIIFLTLASGKDLKSIYLAKMKTWWPLWVGVIGFLLYYGFTASGHAQRFFPNNGVPFSRFVSFTPALLLLVLCNGLREEVWFRGLFLKKYGRFLSPLSANLLSAIIFASFHVQVQYTPFLPLFLGLAAVLGLVFGLLMQKSGSILPSVILHAGSDIPIFLVYLSYLIS